MRRTRWMVVMVVALLGVGLTAPPAAWADAPTMASGNGITVAGWRWITSRTFEVDVTTAKVAANAVNGPHRVRVTLPNTYFQTTTTRFPVPYLLHGGAGATRRNGRQAAGPSSRSPTTSRSSR